MSHRSGQLMVELILATTLAGIVVAIGAQAIFVSLRSNKISSEKNVAQGLLEETMETVRAVAMENWNSIYFASKGSANHYYTAPSGTRWIASAGTNIISLNGIDFSNYFYVENVSRDPSTKNIEFVYNITHDDPSTQKIIAFVSWAGGQNIFSEEYITRWRNKVCTQTNWVNGQTGGVKNCDNTYYESNDGNIDTTTSGSLKLKSL